MNFKEIPGFPEYMVNESGEVYSNYYNKILKQKNCKTGYKVVGLMKDGKRYHKGVHRFVAMTFIPNPENKETVNHKDLNKHNNSIDNLEWCSFDENYRHAIINGAYKRSHNDLRRAIVKYDLDGNEIQEYQSVKVASRLTKLNTGSLSRCLRDLVKTVGGFKWKYKNNNQNLKIMEQFTNSCGNGGGCSTHEDVLPKGIVVKPLK